MARHTHAVNLRTSPYDVLIDRRTRWGNPHAVGYCALCARRHTRTEALHLYRRHLAQHPTLLHRVHTLKDKRLGCWCKPKECHGDILASLADAEPLTVICCGDRDWTQLTPIRRALAGLPPKSVVITGGCRGADTLSEKVAIGYGLQVQRYPANWTRFGKAAGPIRNRQMLGRNPVRYVFVFHDHLDRSRGTVDMIQVAHAAGVKIIHLKNRLWLS